ncbi:uncharacterized protein A4U43_C08F11100 [Asparagus officinalis]|uniref:uncharacterized protein LOC109820635 n=1 Tax=Asparagus officinalis TaxID=4686 RepID=UPI00098E8678|nr:uncharacterized protein LOC109820635 [Asparagus officinalis]ONK59815.1 uncharacterized protein A4U43_C08F11100 [Asparagus officinalis]
MAISPRYLLLLFLISTSPSLISASNLSVISHPSKLQLPPGDRIEGSPGSRPGSIVTCSRVHIHGLSRLRDIDKYAHSLRIRVSFAQGDPSSRAQTVELCLHRNESIGVGMCPETQWQKLAKGSWVQAVPPFGNRIIDIRMLPDSSRSIEVSTELEFLLHRLLFLVIGFIMMLLARVLSESVVFYYGSFMTVGVIIVILIVLFQGMKLLPTGRKSSLAIVLYSSIVGVATFVLHYLSGLLRSILLEIGISEDMHNPLGIFLLVCLVLAGAWFGYWGVRKLVLTDDGLVDSEVSYFVEWAILIFAAVMILQSSLDTLLAAEALIFAIVTTAVARIHGKWRFFRRLFKGTWRGVHAIQDRTSPMSYFSDYPYPVQKSGSTLHRARARSLKSTSYSFPTQGVNKTPEVLSEPGTYYSTFHKTPERKRFSKEEWEQFTKENTREALRELVSSPDFNKWAMDNAERITLTPPNANIRQRKQRRFLWF